ncbi:uncharacterized protein F4822DRAFT_420892 [Hypoxylon trugodes]|uniref:uncharacterized protein n=1 Tax=Hypoxylon trugodes TaxID=326681 RepID=UPI00219D3904|nr:uncharacterized protein F4822DRAFT_420892 [Hypoxylon trugodes]KAI1383520.1 hypothetical protein F4822DRAFT_420892 [Hypoxylon trugodes]
MGRAPVYCILITYLHRLASATVGAKGLGTVYGDGNWRYGGMEMFMLVTRRARWGVGRWHMIVGRGACVGN